MPQIVFRYFAAGKSPQMTRIAIAFHEETAPGLIDAGIPEAEDEIANIPALKIKPRVTADGGISAAALVGLTFFTAWLGNKVLDEIFGEKVSHTIKNLLEKARFNSSTESNEPIEYQSLVCGDLSEPIIAVRVIVHEDDTLAEIMHSMKLAHQHAFQWFSANGKKANIHCHTIKHGQCNIEPELFGNIEDLNKSRSTRLTRNWNPPVKA